MIKFICDRCGEEIKKDFYWTIDIDIKSINDNIPLSSEFCSQKLSSQMTKAIVPTKRIYCDKCKDNICDYISKKETK